eukprot:408701_1
MALNVSKFGNISSLKSTNNSINNTHIPLPNNNNILKNGCFGCKKGCGLCTTKNRNGISLLLQGDYYVSYKLDYVIPIKQHFNCNYTWVSYIMLCICCGLENIGSTK